MNKINPIPAVILTLLFMSQYALVTYYEYLNFIDNFTDRLRYRDHRLRNLFGIVGCAA
jgi:hypothetical protein